MNQRAGLCLDNRDDKREMHQLLARLCPSRRLAFLEWCCSQAAIPNSSVRPGIRRDMRERAALAMREDFADEKLTMEVFLDCWALTLQYGLDLQAAVARLEQIVRRQSA